MASFPSTYSEARSRFLEAAKAAGAELHTYARQDLTGAAGEELACDVAVLGDRGCAAVALVIAGTHGSEAHCGSAILLRWLAEGAAKVAAGGVRAVLVHAINPWAFSHGTRATENNVDLNRNFLTRAEEFSRSNPAYDALAGFLHSCDGSAAEHLAAYRGYQSFLELNGYEVESGSIEGQGTWPEGIFYSGTGPEWSNRVFRQILREHLGGASHVGFIDWHTGVGLYGEIVTLLFDAKGSEAHAAATEWWDLDQEGGQAFVTGVAPVYAGLLNRAIAQELPEAKVAGAVIEFGTVDAYAMFRGDRLDRWLRFEGRDHPDHDALRQSYLDICCPTDVAWRRSVTDRGPRLIDLMIAGVRKWPQVAPVRTTG